MPVLRLELRADAAGAEKTPAAHGFEHAEEADHDQRNRRPQRGVGEDDAGNEENGAGNPTGDAALETDVSLKKSGHAIR